MAIAKKRKKFFDVEIPLISKTTQLQAYEIEELKGKFIIYDLTRILRGKSMVLHAVIEVEDGKALARTKKLKLLTYFLRRIVRKGTNYVDNSFKTQCKDVKIKIKPFLVTRRKVSRAVRKSLREKAKEEILEYVKKKTVQEIFEDIIKNQLQKNLSIKLKKIYPLSVCEIREISIESEEKEYKEKPKKKEEIKVEEKKE